MLSTFLNVKWLKYGRLYIQIRAGALLLLTVLLSLLICISDPPRKSIGTTEQLNATIDKDGYIPNTLLIIILITDFFYALVITLQIFFFIKLRRVSRPAHFIFEVGAVIFTIAFLTTEPTKWSAGVTALLCSWVSLNLFSRYLDVFGLYTIMFYELLFKIVKVLLVGIYYVIGFGLALYIIIGEERLYNLPAKAAFYGSISDLNVVIISNKEEEGTLRYPITTYITIVVFNVLVSITLINLLIGIAVRKTVEIQKNALLYQAQLKIQLFLELDLLIPEFLQHKIFPKEHKIRGSGFGIRRRIGYIYDHFTNLFAYDEESQDNEEAYSYQKDHKMHDMVYCISQMEDQIESILKIVQKLAT